MVFHWVQILFLCTRLVYICRYYIVDRFGFKNGIDKNKTSEIHWKMPVDLRSSWDNEKSNFFSHWHDRPESSIEIDAPKSDKIDWRYLVSEDFSWDTRRHEI